MSNRLTALEVCGESSEQYTPQWVPKEPKLVNLDVEGSEQDLRIMHNLNVLEELSEKNGKFLKDFEVYREAFRFTPSSALVKNDTGETIYVTGTENDRVRFLIYARPEGKQLEVPFFNPKEEDLSNIERSLPPIEIDGIDMIMRDKYNFPLPQEYRFKLASSLEHKFQDFSEINFPLTVKRRGSYNSYHNGPVGYYIPLAKGEKKLELRKLDFVKETHDVRTYGVGFSPEDRLDVLEDEYAATIKEIENHTSNEGGLAPSSFFLNVDEYRETGVGITTLRISL